VSPLVGGRPAGLDEALAAATALLAAARFPLVWGLVESTVEAQRAAVLLARRLGAALDLASTPGHAAALAAFQSAGAATTTLGEMGRRADMVVFWGVDPDEIEPGLVARHAAARPGRVRVAVDLGPGRGPAGAEERLAILPTHETDALVALRALARGRRLDPHAADPLGLPLDALRSLARRLAACEYGVLVSDGDPPPERRHPLRPSLLGALARDLRAKARVRVLAVRRHANAVGAESVLTWLTGFPGSLRLDADAARYDPVHLTAEALLAARAPDAVVVVGADPARFLSVAARAALDATPSVRLGGPPAGDVHIPTASLAATAGHLFRMDGIALYRSRPVPALPTEASVLARLDAAAGGRA
jgi:formylmethanofuran dehydrogenase subunit B